MKIVADEQIPYLSNFFDTAGDITLLPAEMITAEAVKGADVLLVRSVTPVNNSLVANSSLRFIGSATAGIDHMNTQILDEKEIAWDYAPGCNAKAVADYVLLSVAQLIESGIYKKANLKAGVIGVGNVGQQVANTLTKLGFNVVLNDPPRADAEPDFVSTPLSAFSDLDLICIHTPLTTDGKYPTVRFINQDFLSTLNPDCVLLNAGRGACIDTESLINFDLTMILDVWDSEPDIDIALAEKTYIATPHIAGYSQPAKYRATKQLFEAFGKHFEMDHFINPEEDPSEYEEINLLQSGWRNKAINIADLKTLSDNFAAALKANPNDAENIFKSFRKDYVFRPELNY